MSRNYRLLAERVEYSHKQARFSAHSGNNYGSTILCPIASVHSKKIKNGFSHSDQTSDFEWIRLAKGATRAYDIFKKFVHQCSGSSKTTDSQAHGCETSSGGLSMSPILVTTNEPTIKSSEQNEDELRLPRSIQAIYLRPLRRRAKYGVPACDLQLRSYSVRNVEFFADFALRAAYYLKLPASGPVPLRRITERWTVPRSNFVHKKSQENFERITIRRLIQIQDGNLETVEIWLAFLRKHAYYGIGMKANVWEHEQLGVGRTMDISLENLKQVLKPKWAHFGRKKNLDTSEKVMEMMKSEKFRNIDDGPFAMVSVV